MAGKVVATLVLLCGCYAARTDMRAAAGAEVEVEGGVPAVIKRALRSVKGEVNGHVQFLQQATHEAQQAKAVAVNAGLRQETLAAEVEKKFNAAAQSAQRSRDHVIAVEQAATAMAAQKNALNAAMQQWNRLSAEVEGIAKNVSDKEQELTQIMKTLTQQIEELKNQLDDKVKQRDDKEAQMQDLKGKAMSATQFQTGVEQKQAKAEKEMQDDKRELTELQALLDEANTAATQAETAEAAADDRVREAKTHHDFGQTAMRLLKKISDAVNVFYSAGDALEDAMAGTPEGYKTIASNPLLKELFVKYNLMVSAFTELHGFDMGTYKMIESAIEQIAENSMASLHYACDSTATLTKEETDVKCGQNLWVLVQLTRLSFPTLPSSAEAS